MAEASGNGAAVEAAATDLRDYPDGNNYNVIKFVGEQEMVEALSLKNMGGI